ncbi:lysophospholipid acyltransferase family protein [Streptomyces sp. NBC_00334]|uniref:lysophospholipid acyltransferase family protein n=1 Tax=Streptomyces sp. NBC_00334 TaxID=2975713 RepID=UPI002E2E25A6|nr:lysophospholipid acyltransferase family protein [Streptomyces sp. NBC_00334]
MTTLAPARASAPPRHWLASALRRLLWWVTLTLTGGFQRRGRLPRGGCVVIANHSSHADTAALLAALDARHAPVIGAAADYWFASPWRRRICSRLAGGFPVRRDGGGVDDLLAMADELRAGRTVVLFPEGTRRADGEFGTFHRGALVLAEEAGVPLVPVGIAGTDKVLPKHGRLRSGVVRVRIGAPLPAAATPEDARASVAALHARAEAERKRDSGLRRRVSSVINSRWGAVLVFLWAVAEALSWPLIPELLVATIVIAVPRSAVKVSLSIVAGTLAGGLLGLQLAAAGVQLPAPLTTDRMRAQARHEIAVEGADAVRHQPWKGLPYKVYVAEAGKADVPPVDWVVESAKARGSRTAMLTALFAVLGLLLQRFRRWYVGYLVVFAGVFAWSLAGVIRTWS